MMKAEEIKVVGVVGAGLMGHGIAQVFAMAGRTVRIHDKNETVLQHAPERIRRNLELFSDRQFITPSAVEACLSRVKLCPSMSDACDGADLMIESVSELLPIKQSVFAEMEIFSSENALLCTNTSGIRVARIAENLRRKERVIGTHFWNPPQAVQCVEVIRGPSTSDETFETVMEMMKRVGKEPVHVRKDIPGFLGNRLQLALFREALALVEEGAAAPEDIDRVVKYSFGSRFAFIGPFETMDLAGHDLGYEVQKYLFPELSCDKEPFVLKRMVEAGSLGTKTGQGFYQWSEEKLKDLMKRRDVGLLELSKLREKIK
jgi:3-hydroxybutyryl-CoA dehydrogenase